MKKKSTKTTIAGIAIAVAAIATAVAAFASGEPVDFEALAAAIMGALSAIGLIAARDHGVSSKDAGIDE